MFSFALQACQVVDGMLCSYSEAWEGRKKGDLQTPGSPDGLLAAGRVEARPATGSSSPSTAAASDIESPECQAKKCSSLPRIYYATRTHSQISQVRHRTAHHGSASQVQLLAPKMMGETEDKFFILPAVKYS